jgi:hypothetical protein
MGAVDFVAAVLIDNLIEDAEYRHAVRRIRAEFLEMPGMRLTPTQVQRLAGVDGLVCARALDELVKSGLLRRAPSGTYIRATDSAASSRYRF